MIFKVTVTPPAAAVLVLPYFIIRWVPRGVQMNKMDKYA